MKEKKKMKNGFILLRDLSISKNNDERCFFQRQNERKKKMNVKNKWLPSIL